MNEWIVRHHPRRQPKVHLLCLPPAGGGASLFRDWGRRLPAEIDVCAVQLPGRESRIAQRPIRDFALLLHAVSEAVLPDVHLPVALFGHSMGALLAFGLAGELQFNRHQTPLCLFISACPAPNVSPRKGDEVAETNDANLLQDFWSLAGTPDQIVKNEELVDLLIPTIRADFAVCDSYNYEPNSRLACPIRVLGGIEDSIPVQSLMAWQDQTAATFDLHMFPGPHHYIRQYEGAVLETIKSDLVREFAYYSHEPGSS